ncbi:MAG: hypothetical protein JWN24_305 [Phycisphaerales bacterium]|nr:hypothetical protein [Phycisphaerales bacterium]
MRKRTALLTSAILAVTGLGLADPLATFTHAADPADQPAAAPRPADQRQPSDQKQTGDQTGIGADTANRHQAMKVKGVQDLFAQAADAAVMKDGFSQFAGLFADSNSATTGAGRGYGANPAIGASSRDGTRDIQPTRTGSDTADRTGAAADARPGTPAGQREATAERPDPTGTARPGSARADNSARSDNSAKADTKALDNVVDQFNQAWKAKYGKDLRITDGAVVFADITANDITSGQAQPASGRERGIGDQPDATKSTTPGVQGINGNTSNRDGVNAARDTGAGTGAQPNPRPADSATDSRTGANAGNPDRNADRINANEEATVRVPAVGSAQAVTVRLLHTGPGTFRFASNGPVDQQKLASALQKHLQEVIDDKAQWPADENQAQRLVTQHVLMAASDAGAGDNNAQPAGANLPGLRSPAGGTSTDTDRPSGNGAGVAPGTNGSAPR